MDFAVKRNKYENHTDNKNEGVHNARCAWEY